MASKYDALADHLRERSESPYTMRFDAIETLVDLPVSARVHGSWWGNDRTHTQAVNGWLAAGWKADAPDRELQAVTFRK